MEKLPERWYVKPSTIAECKIIGRWFDESRSGYGCDNGPRFYENGCFIGMEMSNGYGFGIRDGAKQITFDQFKRLVLGETEEWEPKVGDWVYIIQGCDYKGRVFQIKEGDLLDESQSPLNYKVQGLGNKWSVKQKQIRPARPEEIPQEEVEYYECIERYNNAKGNNYYEKGKVYQVKDSYIDGGDVRVNSHSCKHTFKPSTREAYEAQQRVQVAINISGDICDGLKSMYKEVNKCSTINKQENECNENKGIILPRKSYDFPRGKRKEGSKIQLTGRVFPSKGRS